MSGTKQDVQVEQRSIFLEVVFDRGQDADLDRRRIRSFFEEGAAELGRGIPDQILAGPPLDRSRLGRQGPLGEPRSPWGHYILNVDAGEKVRKSETVFSAASWQRLRDRLIADKLVSAELDFCILDNDGRRIDGIPHLMLYYEDVDGRWLRLAAMFDAVDLFLPDFAANVRTFLWSMVRETNPAFGFVDYHLRRTRLELELGTIPDYNLPYMRESLRGFGWITIVPKEIGARLGGGSGLVNTRAFQMVDELAGGGYMLQATRTFADYNPDRADRVRSALADVLLTPDLVSKYRAAELQ